MEEVITSGEWCCPVRRMEGWEGEEGEEIVRRWIGRFW